jgi:hypothetical protein
MAMATIKTTADVAFAFAGDQVAEVILRRIESDAELLALINDAEGRERDVCLVMATIAEYLKLSDAADEALSADK